MGMNYEVSIPTKLLFEEELSSIELRLYLIIRAYVNEDGYSRVKNKTLAEYLDTTERHIRRSIEQLKELGLLVVEHDVKKGKIFPENYRRVVWLKEAYDSMHNIREYRENAKTKHNDYKKFVEFVRTEHEGQEIDVKHEDENFGEYLVSDKLMYFKKGEEWFKLSPKRSKEIYKIMFTSRELFFKDKEHLFKEVLTYEEEQDLKKLNAVARMKAKK